MIRSEVIEKLIDNDIENLKEDISNNNGNEAFNLFLYGIGGYEDLTNIGLEDKYFETFDEEIIIED